MSARRATKLHLLLVVALAALFAVAGPVGSADAVMTGLVRVAPNTPSTSAAKSLTATCPAGTRVVGVGGDTTPGNGSVVLDRLRPSASLTSVSLHAGEDQTGTSANWFLQAFIVCATAPTGLELVTATSVSDSSNKSVVASCPSGKRLLGSGAELTGAGGQVFIDGQLPSGGLTSVTVNAVEDETGTTAAWSITAYAICAHPVTGLQRVSAASALDSTANKVATAPCPVGKSVIGLGGTINSANGQVVLDAVFPDAGLTSGNISAFEDADGNSANWSLTAYSICAASAELEQRPDSRITASAVGIVTTCPAGRLATGAGAEVVGGVGRVGIVDLIPAFNSIAQTPSPDVASAGATTFPVQNFDSWSLTGQAICATAFPQQVLTSVTSASDSETEKSATVTCPSGTSVIGAGGSLNDGDELHSDGVMLEAVRPDSTLTTVTATAHEEEGGTSDAWRVVAYAVCASRPAGLRRVTTSSAPGSDETAQATATCPAGTHLIGTGGEIVDGAGEVTLDDLKADAALTKTTVTGFEDHTGYDPDWHVTAYALCMTR